MILLTSIVIAFIVFMAGSFIVATPESYSWDISFEDTSFDELNKKYLVDKTISFSGIYEIEVRVDSPENKTTMIQIFQGNLATILDVWTFRNGEFFLEPLRVQTLQPPGRCITHTYGGFSRSQTKQ